MTPPEQPIACTLTATELPKRMAEIRAIGASSLRSCRADGSEAQLLFHDHPETRERLAAIVAAESVCCAFLAFDLAPTGDGLLLTIRAPEGGAEAVHQLVQAFRGRISPA